MDLLLELDDVYSETLGWGDLIHWNELKTLALLLVSGHTLLMWRRKREHAQSWKGLNEVRSGFR